MPEDKQTVGMHDSENIPHLGPCCLSTMGLYDVIKLRTLHFIYQQPSVIMSVIHPSWFRVIIALCEAIYQTFTLFRFAFYKLRNKKWDEKKIRKRELYSSFNRFKKKVLSNWFPVICNDEPDGTFVVSLTNKRTIRKRDPSINHIITCRLFAIPASLCDENCQTRLLKLFRRRPSHMCETQSSFALKWFRTDSSFETKKSGNSEMGCNTLSLKWLWFENKRYNTSSHKPIHLLQKFFFQLLSQYLKKKTTGN